MTKSIMKIAFKVSARVGKLLSREKFFQDTLKSVFWGNNYCKFSIISVFLFSNSSLFIFLHSTFVFEIQLNIIQYK